MTIVEHIASTLISKWQRGGGSKALVAVIIAASCLAALFAVMAELSDPLQLRSALRNFSAGLAIVAFLLSYGSHIYERLLEDKRFWKKIETVEEQIRANPRETQLAWVLAQAKLENYLNRNLAQVRSIYWLTAMVMIIGFAFILYGVVRAFDAPDKLPVAIIAAVSGVLVSFIGGSFLLIYNSTTAQSRDYVSVLERINAVGMAVQILETIPESNSQLKDETRAEISKQLLFLYSPTQTHGSSLSNAGAK